MRRTIVYVIAWEIAVFAAGTGMLIMFPEWSAVIWFVIAAAAVVVVVVNWWAGDKRTAGEHQAYNADIEADSDRSRTGTIWLASPGAGRTAAKLIAQASTEEEVREIWGAFFNAPRRTDTNWAYWAFISRLEEFGRGDEVYDLSFDLTTEEDIDPTEEIEATIKKWRGSP